jgi:hypothetical protein
MNISLFRSIQAFVDLIQNITRYRDPKPDDCNAAYTRIPSENALSKERISNQTSNFARMAARMPGWHGRCSFQGCCWSVTSTGFSGVSTGQFKKEISIMLWTILVILLVLWLIGLLSNVGGGLIHLLLVVAVVVLIINLVTGRRAV